MEKNTQPAGILRKRKFLLVLPILVLPFITLLFWVMGGGNANEASGRQTKSVGLNTSLPDAHFKDDQSLSKMSFYELAAKDSAKLHDEEESDSYYRSDAGITDQNKTFESNDPLPSRSGYQGLNDFKDPNEEKVYRKLDELNWQLNQPVQSPLKTNENSLPRNESLIKNEEVDRLENMMKMMKEGNGGNDPEMLQLDAMLEKILAIQHPDQVTMQKKEPAKKGKENLLSVSTSSERTNGFFTTEEDITDSNQTSIQAEIVGTQVLVSGATIKLRLLKDIFIKDIGIPKGTFVFGETSLNNERLKIQINSIRSGNSILPVRLQAFDLDGMEGIFIPGSITRDVAKQSVNDLTQSIGMSALDPSIVAQATTAGINAAKSMLSAKVRLIKVTVPNGYKVFLVDEALTY